MNGMHRINKYCFFSIIFISLGYINYANGQNKVKVYQQDNVKFILKPLRINENQDETTPYRKILLDYPVNVYKHLLEKEKNESKIPWKYTPFTWSHSFFEHAGVSLIDLNQDGWLDIFAIINGEPRIYINTRNNGFSPHTIYNNLQHVNSGFWADYNNDGHLDVYLTRYARLHLGSSTLFPLSNILLRNNGDLTFTDVTKESNLLKKTFTQGAAWADYDNDGDLDLYVSNFGQNNELLTNRGTFHDYEPDQFYRNENGEYFTNIFRYKNLPYQQQKNKLWKLGKNFTDQNGIIETDKFASMQPIWFDCNNDSKQDLFIPTRFRKSFVSINLGNDAFKNQPLPLLTQSNGAIIQDFNNDGFFDILEITMNNKHTIFFNNGQCQFDKIKKLVTDPEEHMSWGGISLDTFNTGYKDIYFISGYPVNTNYITLSYKENKKAKPSSIFKFAVMTANKNQYYRNNKNQNFINKSFNYSLSDFGTSRGIAKGDINNDGKIDFVMNNIDNGLSVHLNQSKTLNNSLSIQLLSENKKNLYNVGAKVSIFANNTWQHDNIRAGDSLLSQNSNILHFGLGLAKKADKIKIKWANGKKTLLKDIPANNQLIIFN